MSLSILPVIAILLAPVALATKSETKPIGPVKEKEQKNNCCLS